MKFFRRLLSFLSRKSIAGPATTMQSGVAGNSRTTTEPRTTLGRAQELNPSPASGVEHRTTPLGVQQKRHHEADTPKSSSSLPADDPQQPHSTGDESNFKAQPSTDSDSTDPAIAARERDEEPTPEARSETVTQQQDPVPKAAASAVAAEPTKSRTPEKLLVPLTIPNEGQSHTMSPPGITTARVSEDLVRMPTVLPIDLAREQVEDLMEHEASLREVLGSESVLLRWPRVSVGQELVVPNLPDRFVTTDDERQPRMLSLAVVSRDSAPATDPFDRLELTRLVAICVDALHRRRVFTSGVTLVDFVYTLDPRPEVALLSASGVRSVGGEFLGTSPDGDEPDSMDRDRRDFAVLARNLLGADDLMMAEGRQPIPGVAPRDRASLDRLWARAEGPVGTRPQIREWLEVLGR